MKSRKCTALVLIALVVLALAPAANAGTDYSKNAAGGDYAPAVSTGGIDYSKNAAGGDYAPAVAPTVTPTASEPVSSDGSGFDWGAAAIGAGAALGLVLLSVPVLHLQVRRTAA
jgi:hypothetical protein